MNNILLALTFGGIILLVKYIVVLFLSVFSGHKFSLIKQADWKGDIFSFAVIVILFYICLELYFYFEVSKELYATIIFTVFFASIPTTYAFVIHPIYYLLNQKEYQVSSNYQNWITDKTSEKVTVRLINKDVTNAFATGVVPFLKVILVGKSTENSFSEEEMKCLLLHEVGHTKLNHLQKLYFANFLYVTFYVITTFFIFPYLRTFEYEHLLIGIYCGLMLGGGSIFFVGMLQKSLEKDADCYAAKIMGKDKYQQMLIKLNTITNGGLEKWAINYPSLKERLANVESV